MLRFADHKTNKDKTTDKTIYNRKNGPSPKSRSLSLILVNNLLRTYFNRKPFSRTDRYLFYYSAKPMLHKR